MYYDIMISYSIKLLCKVCDKAIVLMRFMFSLAFLILIRF